MSLDPVTLAVIQNGLMQVCNEMDLAFVRAAFSPVISEALDRSDGIYHRETGELIAQGELGLPVFVGTMQFGTQAVIEQARDLRPGDVYIVNDPYLGGTHLMDVRFNKPFFYRASCSPGSPTPGTGRIPAAWCPAAFPPTPPKWSRRACACPRSSSTRKA